MGRAVAHVGDALFHMLLDFPWPAEPPPGIEAHQIRHRPADVNQAVRVLEEIQVAAVPGHQITTLTPTLRCSRVAFRTWRENWIAWVVSSKKVTTSSGPSWRCSRMAPMSVAAEEAP